VASCVCALVFERFRIRRRSGNNVDVVKRAQTLCFQRPRAGPGVSSRPTRSKHVSTLPPPARGGDRPSQGTRDRPPADS
jgi:hypothetical protein